MNINDNCPKCAANMSPLDFVCDFCGHVKFEKVKNTGDLGIGKAMFENGIEIIKSNLNALLDIPKPNNNQSVKLAIRLLLALFTLGIILIFWRRPKKRFHKNDYDKLKSIINRDISFLRISSEGSIDLMNRIKVLENELHETDKKVKKAIIFKSIAQFIALALYIIWFSYIISLEPKKHSTYIVTAYDTVVMGNLAENIQIGKDTVVIFHTPSGDFYEWEMTIQLTCIKGGDANLRNSNINANLFLSDDKGLILEGFKPGEMEKGSLEKFQSALINGNIKNGYFKFLLKNDFNFPQYIDTIPINATKYIIKADTSYHLK